MGKIGRMTVAGLALAGLAVLAGCQTGGGIGAVDTSVPIGFCPEVEVPPDAAFTQVYERGGEGSASRLIYQATINSTARECRAANGVATFSIGIGGRVIAGPRGGGTVAVPVRVQILVGGQTAINRVYTATASLAPPTNGGPFFVVDDAITMPIPPENQLVEIVVGFDR